MADVPSIEIANTPDDYRVFMAVSRSRVGPMRYLPALAGGVLAFAVLWGLPPLIEGYFALYSYAPVVLGVAGALLVWMIALRLLSRYALQRSFDRDGAFMERKRLTLADDGVHVESPHSRTHIFWTAIWDVIETRSHIFLMVDRTSGTIIPKRSFATSAEAEAFVAAVKRRIAAKAA